MPTMDACRRLSIAPHLRSAGRVLWLTLVPALIGSSGWMTAATAACYDYSANPRLAGRLDLAFHTGHRVALDGSLAYVTSYSTGLYVVDVSDPDAPEIVGELATPGDSALDVALDGTHVYVADLDVGTYIIDVSEPTAPVLVATVSSAEGAFELGIEGTTLCVATGDGGLQIVDITDPSAPQILTVLPFTNNVRSVIVENSLAYVIEAAQGLWVVDVSNPSAPSVIGSAPYYANDMAISGNHLFLSTGRPNPFRESDGTAAMAGDEYGLRILDVSDPTQPAQIGWIGAPGHDVTLAGDVAIVTEVDWNWGGGSCDWSTSPISPIRRASSSCDAPVTRWTSPFSREGSTWAMRVECNCFGPQTSTFPLRWERARHPMRSTSLFRARMHTWRTMAVGFAWWTCPIPRLPA